METGEHHVLVMGLPRTGKTTFLAALWDVVDSENIGGSLVLENVDGDQKHLNDIRDLWANCEEIPRTRVAEEKTVSMNLHDRKSDVKSCVSFPDMDGEAFQRQWTDREWPQSHAEIVRRSDSALLFIHPGKVKEGPLIRDARPLIATIAQVQGDGQAANANAQPSLVESAGGRTVPATPTFAPTQVQLVEILQFMQRHKGDVSGFKLGVIISAWDVVMKQGKSTPDRWLQDRLPMLHQYLLAHRETVHSRIYGVSAQGGDITKEAVRLRAKHSPSERIIVVEGKTTSSDITIPVRWAMGATEAVNHPPAS